MMPVVVIVGRPNVGKSTFFNLLSGRAAAIVEDEPGVTRDLNYAPVTIEGASFWLVDSGGYDTAGRDELAAQIREQIDLAVAEADLVLFLMDGRSDPTPGDHEIADLLRRAGKRVLHVVNKVDNERIEAETTGFFSLGIERFHPVSSKNRRGLRDLLDALREALPEATGPDEADREDEVRPCRIAFVGRPNVGKSSLVNALVGARRVLVSPEPGTTRDAIEVPFEHAGEPFVLIDTAGIRRRAKVHYRVETYAVVRALRALDRCDVALTVLDGSQEITAQDERIAGYVQERGRGCVLLVNKWDLAPRGARPLKEYEAELRARLGFLAWAPILFVSAATGKGLEKILPTVARVRDNHRRRVATGPLNDWLARAVAAHSPPLVRGRRLKFYYMTQTGIRPPTFVAFANDPQAVHFSYERYLTNRLRELADFEGTPVRLLFRKRGEERTRR